MSPVNLVCSGVAFHKVSLRIPLRYLGLANNQKGLALLEVQLPRDPGVCRRVGCQANRSPCM